MALEINSVNEPLSYDPSDKSLSLELNSIEQSPIQISDDGHIILNIDDETLTVVQDRESGAWMLAVSSSVTGGDDELGLDYAFLGHPGQVYTVSEDGTEAVWMDPQGGGGGGGTEYSFGTGLKIGVDNLVEVDEDYINTATRAYVNNAETRLQDEIDDFLNIVQELNVTIATKQDKLVSGTNIKTINGNSVLGYGNISIDEIAIIGPNDATIERDDTKGVSPYNTGYGYTNITLNTITPDKLKSGFLLMLLCDNDDFKVDSAYRNTRIRFGSSGAWIPLYLTSSIANGSSYLGAYSSRILYYSRHLVSTGAFHVLTDSNSTYTPAGLGFGYGTCTTAASTSAKVVTLSNYALTSGGVVSVRFTYDVPANATMNINSKGAKNIFYNNAKITAGVIHAGDVATFIYDGTQYRLIAINTDITNKQEKLVSGTNIKTINGNSILGSGNIEIQGGGVSFINATISENDDGDFVCDKTYSEILNALFGNEFIIAKAYLQNYDRYGTLNVSLDVDTYDILFTMVDKIGEDNQNQRLTTFVLHSDESVDSYHSQIVTEIMLDERLGEIENGSY